MMLLSVDMNSILLQLASVLAILLQTATAAKWSYDDKDPVGPSNWRKSYTECSSSNNQSPILLELSKAGADISLAPITFANYDTLPNNGQWYMQNNGHTVLLRGNYSCSPHIQDGSLGGNYDFIQLHFHWGNDDLHGSEHHLDGKQFPLELHLVHKYRENPPGRRNPLKLAVVGLFFDLAENDNVYLQPLVDALAEVTKPSQEVNVTLANFDLKSLLPSSREYFRYNGSLTTPPCSADVRWSVFRESLPISSTQLKVFRQLQGDAHDPLVQNFRPLQDKVDRQVLIYLESSADLRRRLGNFTDDKKPSSATRVENGFWCFFALIASVYVGMLTK